MNEQRNVNLTTPEIAIIIAIAILKEKANLEEINKITNFNLTSNQYIVNIISRLKKKGIVESLRGISAAFYLLNREPPVIEKRSSKIALYILSKDFKLIIEENTELRQYLKKFFHLDLNDNFEENWKGIKEVILTKKLAETMNVSVLFFLLHSE